MARDIEVGEPARFVGPGRLVMTGVDLCLVVCTPAT